MAIPDYQAVMLPLLEAISDGGDHIMRDVTSVISDRFALSDEERAKMLPSGAARVIVNRVGWAKTDLKNAGLLEQPKRAVIRLTKEGKSALANKPSEINREWLKQYPAFVEYLKPKKNKVDTAGQEEPEETDSIQTPEELIESSYTTHRNALAADLLDQIKSCSPAFFERLVVELLVAMGYGGSIEDAGKAIGGTGDGGIDGIIKEDKLGLDVVVMQAKRWDKGTVGRPDVQAFAGSMEPHRAKKGVFITTSHFSKGAIEYVDQIERKIVLVDGGMLATLMIDYNIGVSPYRSIVLRRIDQDYFEEPE